MKKAKIILSLTLSALIVFYVSVLWLGVERANASELPEEARTRTSRTLIYPDGSGTIDASVGSVYYQDESDNWQPINNFITASDLYWDYEMTEAGYKAYFYSDFTYGQIASWEKNGSYIRLQPMNLEYTNNLAQIQLVKNPQSVQASLNNSPVELLPDLDGYTGSMTWENAYGSGIDFTWEAATSRLNKYIRINELEDLPPVQAYISAGGDPVLRFNMIFDPSPDLSIYINGELWDRQTKTSTLDTIDFMKNGEVICGFMPLYYWDSAGSEARSVATIEKRGGSLYITVKVPYSWLESAVYPVFIDADIDEQVGASENDGHVYGSVSFDNAGNNIIVGNDSGASVYSSFHLFTGISGLSGATITDAYVEHLGYSTAGIACDTLIYAEDAESPSAPSDHADYDSRVVTSASVEWDSDWSYNVWEQSDNLSSIIQELADSYDPDAILILEKDDGSSGVGKTYHRCYSYDEGSASAGKLHIEYTSGAGSSPPTVATGNATSVEETTATLAGNVTATGGENVTRGFRWDTDSGDPYVSSWDDDGLHAAGSYTHALSGLSKGEGYYFIATANHTGGTGNGSEEFFITKPDPATAFGSTDNGSSWISLSWTNGDGMDHVEVRYDTGSAPSDNLSGSLGYWGSSTSANVSGLSSNTTYHFTLFTHATENGVWSTSDNSPTCQDTTDVSVGAATVVSVSSSLVEETTATATGNITDTGGENCDYRGVQWGTSPGTYSNNSTEAGSFGAGAYNVNLTGLPEGDCIYWRSMVHNAAGWSYGSELYFITKPQAPTGLSVDNQDADEIAISWTAGSGSENSTVVYSLVGYPGGPDQGTSAYNGTGSSCNITVGIAGQIVYIEVYACSTDNGTTYSDSAAQATDYTLPAACSGASASGETCSTADLSWTKGSGGDYTMIRWQAGSYPSGPDQGTEGYHSTGDNTTLTGLPKDSTIYIVFYSRDSDSGYYSATAAQTTATTLETSAPTVQTDNASDITDVSAALNGQITGVSCQNATMIRFQIGTSSGNYTNSWNNTGSFNVGSYDYSGFSLSANTTYYYIFEAQNDGGLSQGSEVSFTTSGEALHPPTDFSLVDLGGIGIAANWTASDSGNVTGYLIVVSRIAYPDQVAGFEIAYSGNATSVNMSGYSVNNTRYYFSNFTVQGSSYSPTYATAAIGSLQDTTEFIRSEDMEEVAAEMSTLNTLLSLFMSMLPAALIIGLAHLSGERMLFVLSGFSTIAYAFLYDGDLTFFPWVLALLGVYEFIRAAVAKPKV